MTYGEMVAGRIPNFTSDSVNVALLRPSAMSQQEIRPTPPPNAAPCTTAIVGNGSRFNDASISPSRVASARFCSRVYDVVFFIHVKSAPAQNTLPFDRMNAARTPGTCTEQGTCGEPRFHAEASCSQPGLKSKAEDQHEHTLNRQHWVIQQSHECYPADAHAHNVHAPFCFFNALNTSDSRAITTSENALNTSGLFSVTVANPSVSTLHSTMFCGSSATVLSGRHSRGDAIARDSRVKASTDASVVAETQSACKQEQEP